MSFTSRIAAAAARGYGMFAAVARAVDPFFNYVTALLHGDGTNGAQNNTFLDSSTNNFTITRNGNTTQGTFSPFSQTGWSNYFDGSGDYLTAPNNAAFALPADFTVEAWVYFNNNTTSVFCGNINSSGYGDWAFFYNNAAGLRWLTDNSTTVLTAAYTMPLNAWTHVAISRSGTNVRFFANGALLTTVTNSSSNTFAGTMYIGSSNDGGLQFPGYMSNLRIVKGTAVYTAAFTPPTVPLTAISGTSLLTCQANRFLDASSNNFAITRNGDVSVQAFSPFNPTSAWSASSNGGSGYFDGSGDYLTVAANTAFDVSASAYTFETWVYFTTAPSVTIMFGLNGTGITGYANLLYSGGTLYWQQRGTSTNQTTYTWSPTLGQWYHIAIGWNGSNSLAMWINGTRVATNTVSPTGAGQNGINFGAASDGYAVGGYMSNFRLVKGADVYGVGNATITVPTAPLTAISNTSFLLNFTNAGIYDNAAVGDYETVGNAQVSTSVVKYGTGSMYFDGTGDYLIANTPVKNVYALGAGDFTIECWVYFNSISNTPQFISGYAPPSTTTYNWAFYLPATGTLAYYLSSTGTTWDIANGVSFGTTFTTGVWYHIALVRVGNKITPYVNGNAGTSTTSTATIYNNNGPIYVGGISTYVLNGYIDDFRFTKGVGRYPYNFTPPTAAFPNIGGTVTLTADPYFRNTTLLLPGNGTNGAQNNTFLDSSSNAFTITRNGNTTQGTFTPFSQTGWSNYFNGSSYVTTPNVVALSADFTIETWVYYPDSVNSGYYISSIDASGYGYWSFYYNTSVSAFRIVGSSAGTYIQSPAVTLQPNQWMHVAVTRSGTTVTWWVNGTSIGTTTNSTNWTGSAATTYIGTINGSTANFTGYLSNLRVVVGTAVYTTNFTPSTTPLTAVSGTWLLTAQSNRFVDRSSNAYALTSTSASIQAFSPFAPTAAWSASTNGGSGYFDGSGDYLTVPDNAAFDFGSGDFTISAWVYPQGAGAIIDQGGGGASSNRSFEIYMSSASAISNAYISSDGNYNASYNLTGTTVPNAWNFVEFTRSSGTIRLFVNGTLQSSAAANFTIFNSTATVAIGNTSQNTVNPFTGYIADVRVLKGTGSASSTVPTAPLTAIANTQLLLSYTNGGITDATAKNDLETVGNAQISTTQSKFGGSSMAFDGSGDYLSLPATATNTLSAYAGDFTIEMWLYPTAVGQANNTQIFMQGSPAGFSPIVIVQTSGTYSLALYSSANGSSWGLASGASIGTATANAWNHIAVCRYGTNVYCFLNGVLQSTTSFSTTALMTTTSNLSIGSSNGYASTYFTGYIDDFRITKGIARYTSNFTPPTSAFLLQ